LKILYKNNQFPVLQNKLYENAQEAFECNTGDILIAENEKTGLIYNYSFDPKLIVYDENYDNEQGYSVIFNNHLDKVANLIEASIGKLDLVEVGCGKGFFLEMLLNRGFDVVGIDPAYNGKNERIIKKHFTPSVFPKKAKGIILRHVLEHIQNPYNFLCQLRDANKGSGLIYIEVPCFDWILNKKAWFDLFYEHVNYFRLNDFDRMFKRVITKGHFFGDQYLYVVADLSSLQEPIFDQSHSINCSFSFDQELNFENIKKNKLSKKTICVWGAASKGVIFSLLLKRANLSVDFVVDINPAKQEKFLPLTGLKVISPAQFLSENQTDTIIYIMNSNYFTEIKKITKNKFKYILIDQEKIT